MILIDALLHFVFPSLCPSCGLTLSQDQALCKGCFSELEWFNVDCCCTRCLAGLDPDEALCLSCKRGFFYPDKLMLTLESGAQSQMIVKNLNNKNMVKMAASFMVIHLSNSEAIYDGIVAMPGSKDLAHELAGQTKIPLYHRKLNASNWLVVGSRFYSHSALNKAAVELQKKIFGKISFLFLI